MEKVKLTKSQAEEIERIKKIGHPVYWKEDGWLIERSENLVGLSFQAYMNAIYKGYEVEPEFKVGDWVVIKFEGKEWVTDLTEKRGPGFFTDSSLPYEKQKLYSNSILRHATPEEIATEKTRRWWKKHDRDVWELSIGDVLDFNGNLIHVIDEFAHGYFLLSDDTQIHPKELINSDYSFVCFAHDRKDI